MAWCVPQGDGQRAQPLIPADQPETAGSGQLFQGVAPAGAELVPHAPGDAVRAQAEGALVGGECVEVGVGGRIGGGHAAAEEAVDGGEGDEQRARAVAQNVGEDGRTGCLCGQDGLPVLRVGLGQRPFGEVRGQVQHTVDRAAGGLCLGEDAAYRLGVGDLCGQVPYVAQRRQLVEGSGLLRGVGEQGAAGEGEPDAVAGQQHAGQRCAEPAQAARQQIVTALAEHGRGGGAGLGRGQRGETADEAGAVAQGDQYLSGRCGDLGVEHVRRLVRAAVEEGGVHVGPPAGEPG